MRYYICYQVLRRSWTKSRGTSCISRVGCITKGAGHETLCETFFFCFQQAARCLTRQLHNPVAPNIHLNHGLPSRNSPLRRALSFAGSQAYFSSSILASSAEKVSCIVVSFTSSATHLLVFQKSDSHINAVHLFSVFYLFPIS